MAEQNALKTFDWESVTGKSLFLKFEAGKPVTLRVLTVDPVVKNDTYTDPTGEVTLTTKFNFIVYNFTDERAQILSASPSIARKIGELDADPDFGANIKTIDIKITPTGEKLQRRYDIQVLPRAHTLTAEQVEECRAINLDEKIDGGQRMSFYTPPEREGEGYANARAKADELKARFNQDEEPPIEEEDPINLDDIPF